MLSFSIAGMNLAALKHFKVVFLYFILYVVSNKKQAEIILKGTLMPQEPLTISLSSSKQSIKPPAAKLGADEERLSSRNLAKRL